MTSSGGISESANVARQHIRARELATAIAGRIPSRLTLRIIAINLVPIIILFCGVVYLDRYQNSLIQSELDSLARLATTLARAMGEFTVEPGQNTRGSLMVKPVQRMVKRSAGTLHPRVEVFNAHGDLIADSMRLGSQQGLVQIRPLPPPPPEHPMGLMADELYDIIVNWLPRREGLPRYQETVRNLVNRSDVVAALKGSSIKSVQATETGGLVLSVAVPVQHYKEVLGALLLSMDGAAIDKDVRAIRGEMLLIFLIVFAITIALSVYQARTITRPVQRLAAAAERVRTGRNRQHSIPDLSTRHDEIGDLAGALSEMTENLWDRMDATERFAADVAHEIKNPLTSVRSAVETAKRIDDPEMREQLFQTILTDVHRLDRLISDIAEASSVDSELSRETAALVDIAGMVTGICEVYVATGLVPDGMLECQIEGNAELFRVHGHDDRMAQVFRNLIDNAISFTPPEGRIRINVAVIGANIEITVDDDGIGIPDGKLSAIFNRFYTERPAKEKFGTHSGLGLSISRQIVEVHDGKIVAENRRSSDGIICGARFIVTLPRIGAANNRAGNIAN